MSIPRSGMQNRRNFIGIVPSSLCSDRFQIQMLRWFHVSLQASASGKGLWKCLVSTTCTKDVCRQLRIRFQNHQPRAHNPLYSFVFYPCSRVLNLFCPGERRSSNGLRCILEALRKHGKGNDSQPPGNACVARILWKRHPNMNRQKSDERCGSGKRQQSSRFHTMFREVACHM